MSRLSRYELERRNQQLYERLARAEDRANEACRDTTEALDYLVSSGLLDRKYVTVVRRNFPTFDARYVRLNVEVIEQERQDIRAARAAARGNRLLAERKKGGESR